MVLHFVMLNRYHAILKAEMIDLLLDHKLIRDFSNSSDITIPSSIEIFGPSCFRSCGSLSSISSESPSRLKRIESLAFSSSSLRAIVIPRSVQFINGSTFCDVELSSCDIECENDRFVVENHFLIDIVGHKLIHNFSNSSDITIPSSIEILGPFCFCECESLLSISFESPSCLARVESRAFADSNVRILLPSTLVFLPHDPHSDLSQFSLSDPDFCSVFDRWRRVRESGVAVDFRPILKPHPDHLCFKNLLFDIVQLEEESLLLEADRSSNRLYRMRRDGSLIVVKSIFLSDSISKSQIESEIANLVSLRHPLIASPIGFAESTAPGD
jgi:hypothetical protein